MNQPTPAIVSAAAVRRLPRWALLLLCAAYVIPGFVGRSPWKNNDIVAFGYMRELAEGRANWLLPSLGGNPIDVPGLLPYWIGALAVRVAPSWMTQDMAARIPFMVMLAATLAATWYAVYSLARRADAQPVAFAFGGEASPTDYARALADGGLLALLACLGLAQLSHEATAYLAQLCSATLMFVALAGGVWRWAPASVLLLLGALGLTLSGAPTVTFVLALVGVLTTVLERDAPWRNRRRWLLVIALCAFAAATAGWLTDQWRWRLIDVARDGIDGENMLRLLVWFAWPAWPLALVAVWRWRARIFSRRIPSHLLLPLWFTVATLTLTLFTQPRDRMLLLGLPALAALAAFALPTLSRTLSAIIDWFTLLFYSIAGLALWWVWLAYQTGFPAKTASNVARLAPSFVAEFSLFTFALGVLGTVAWGWLVAWRVGRHRPALWKSLALPAGGTVLAWVLLMTLWLQALDYIRSYAPLVGETMQVVGKSPRCIQYFGLTRAQYAGFSYHANASLQPLRGIKQCPWLIVDSDALPALAQSADLSMWQQQASLRRANDRTEHIVVFKRAPAEALLPFTQ